MVSAVRSAKKPLENLPKRALAGLSAPIGWHTALAFVLLALIIRTLDYLTDASDISLDQSLLLSQALENHVAVVLAVGFALAVAAQFGKGSLLVRWADLQRGLPLQVFAAVVMFLLTWRYAGSDYDYVHGQWHEIDRGLVVLAAVLAVYRPVFLILFLFQVGLLQASLVSGFDSSVGSAGDALPILALAAIASVVVLGAILGFRTTATLVPLLAAGIAMQFFDMARSRYDASWFTDNDLTVLPLNSYQQGWLGSTGGGLIDLMSDAVEFAHRPLMAGLAIIGLGAVVVVLHRGALMVALAAFVTAHVLLMAASGVSFLDWVVVELAFFMLLADPIGRRWSKPAFNVVPLALSVGVVFFGGSMLGDSLLSTSEEVWFDGPVTYSYEFNGFDTEGEDRALVASDFAPYGAVFATGSLDLGPTPPLAGGYGTVSQDRLEELADVESFGDLEALEVRLDTDGTVERRDRSIENISNFLLATSRDETLMDLVSNPLHRFWTGREGHNYDSGIELVELTVTRVTTLRLGENVETRREPVYTFFVVGERVEVTQHSSR